MRHLVCAVLLTTAPLCASAAALPELIPSTSVEIRNIQREEEDLSAQISMARSAELSLKVSLAALAFSAIAAVCVAVSLWQTRTSISDNRSFGRRQTRAYVQAVGAEIGDDKVIRLRIENTGQTPALNLLVGGEFERGLQGKLADALLLGEDYVFHEWGGLGAGQKQTVRPKIHRGEGILYQWKSRKLPANEAILVKGWIYYTDIYGFRFRSGFAFTEHRDQPMKFVRPIGHIPAFEQIEQPTDHHPTQAS